MDELDLKFNKLLCEAAKKSFGVIRPRTKRMELMDDDYTKSLFGKMQEAKKRKEHERADGYNKTLREERAAIRKAKFGEYCLETCNLPRGQQISKIARISRAMSSSGEGSLWEKILRNYRSCLTWLKNMLQKTLSSLTLQNVCGLASNVKKDFGWIARF